MTFKRIMFEAARSYANGKEEEQRSACITICLIIKMDGILITVANAHDHKRHVVSWHDIEHRQYDALREGIDEALRKFHGGRVDGD